MKGCGRLQRELLPCHTGVSSVSTTRALSPPRTPAASPPCSAASSACLAFHVQLKPSASGTTLPSKCQHKACAHQPLPGSRARAGQAYRPQPGPPSCFSSANLHYRPPPQLKLLPPVPHSPTQSPPVRNLHGGPAGLPSWCLRCFLVPRVSILTGLHSWWGRGVTSALC